MATPGDSDSTALYLELLKRCLTRYRFEEPYVPYRVGQSGGLSRWWRLQLQRALQRRQLELVRRSEATLADREVGRDWPVHAESMIGLARLSQLQAAVEDVVARDVPGDLIETGVWRGGACIFMRAVLAAHGVTDRTVWVADSFEGLPPPNPDEFPADAGDQHWLQTPLQISLDEVQANFDRYGMLDDRVRFLKGWFKDTLPTAPIERLAVLRLDGDMYESTIQALEALYPKVSVGGYVIVDDYGLLPGCKAAVEDYRSAHGISDAIVEIDHSGVYWTRT